MTRVSKAAGQQYFLLHPGKKGTRLLPVPIDDKIVARLQARLADLTSERLALETKKRDAVAPLNKRLAEIRAEEKKLDEERHSKETEAEVEVEERASLEDRVAWLVRLDTGLEVPNSRRPLSHEETQAFARGPEGELRAVPPVRGTAADPDAEDEEPGEKDPKAEAEALFAKPAGTPPAQGDGLPGFTPDAPEDFTGKAPKPSGPKLAPSKLTLSAPLDAWSALRFPPVGMVTVYHDGRAVAAARFDTKADALVFTSGEPDVPKKVVDALNDAIRFGELPIPGATREPVAQPAEPETPAAVDAAPAETSAKGDALSIALDVDALKLTANDAAALKVLREASGAPLFPEKIGNLTRNRRPGTTVQRLEGFGLVARGDEGYVLTAAGTKAAAHLAALAAATTKPGRGGKRKTADEARADARVDEIVTTEGSTPPAAKDEGTPAPVVENDIPF